VIDLVKDLKSHETSLTNLLNGQKEEYFGHLVFKNLQNRKDKLRKSNNMDFGQEKFLSKLGFPIQKATSLMRKFIFDQNYASDQLYYVKETESTNAVIAKNIEDTLNDNVRRTKFISTDFNYLKLELAEYGTAVCYSTPGRLHNSHMITQMKKDQLGNPIGIERVRVDTPDIVIKNQRIDSSNYFQDPDAIIPEYSNYQGHLERWYVPEFLDYIKNPAIKFRNISAIKKKLNSEGWIDQFYHRETLNGREEIAKKPVDMTKIYSLCNIKGNEDNTIPYYIEMVDGKIIRIEKDLFDENLRPYAILTFIPRLDTWWGNTDGEFVLSHENATNTLIGLKIDTAIQAQDQTIFHKKGSIDAGDWNNRHNAGGFVGVDVPDGINLSHLLFPFQSNDQSLGTFDSAMREINASRQSMASAPNVNQRVSKTGPLQNTTAKAVSTMEEQGDIKEGSYTRQANYGIVKIAQDTIALMKQFFPDSFSIMSSAGKQEKFLNKEEILGSTDVIVRTSLTNNKAFEAQRLLNAINTIYNLKGTQQGSAMAIQEGPVIKKWLDRLDVGDPTELYNENFQQPGLPPQVQQQGAAVA